MRVDVLLKDSDESYAHNCRIMDYLNDRYKKLNDAQYAIAIDIIDDDNINDYVKRGVESIPALIVDDDIEYGVNNILATLAKLEVSKTSKRLKEDKLSSEEDHQQQFRDRVLKEMMSGTQDDNESASTVKVKGQDYAETPINDKDISEKMSQYDSYYSERKKHNNLMDAKLPSRLKECTAINC